MTDSKLTDNRSMGDIALLESIKNYSEDILKAMEDHNKDLTIGEFQAVLGVEGMLEGVLNMFRHRMRRDDELRRERQNLRDVLNIPKEDPKNVFK